jgi:hypothetical protein
VAPDLHVKILETQATMISVQALGYSVHFCRLDLVMSVRPGAVGVVGGELEGCSRSHFRSGNVTDGGCECMARYKQGSPPSSSVEGIDWMTSASV